MVELSIIVPTYKELENVCEVVDRVAACLNGVQWEIIFVDDNSPDDTAGKVREIARQTRRVRCLHRIGRRGLSSACIEGMLSSSAPYIAVMDADLQHDEKLLPVMFQVLKNTDADIAIGSRYVEGGGVGEWSKSRSVISRFATRLSRLVIKADLTDPMSGFFMIRSDAMMLSIRNGMSGIGFKILLDLFASAPQPLRFKELPYHFRNRRAGESKLDSTVAWEYVLLLLDKVIGKVVPIRFVAFSLIGCVGIAIHIFVLAVLHRSMGISFIAGQTIATLVAMTSNFFLNNFLTYYDMRLRGWQMLRGWISFTLACSVGALANIGVAAYLFMNDTFWLPSALAGVLAGAVWNYAVSSFYTWREA